jgi:sugar lactone lactonase YvrE
VSPDGDVTTVAGDGTPGFADGPARQARFNGPIGLAIDSEGRLLVADTYNDRVRVIHADGRVTTLAGGGAPGLGDGIGDETRFDTPSGVTVAPDGRVLVADTGNGAIREIDAHGRVTTPPHYPALVRPTAIAAGADGEIYVTDDRGLILAIPADAPARTLAGSRAGFRDGVATDAEFRRPSGLVVVGEGRLVVTDPGNALVRIVAEPARLGWRPPASPRVQPAFDADGFRWLPLLWPVQPWEGPHEIAGTLGEARGARAERLHNGVDVRIEQGTAVHAVRDGVVDSPIATGAFGTLNEWIRIGPVTYVHVRAGRARGDRLYDRTRFVPHYDDRGRLAGIRVKRGAHFTTGDVVASVNAFNHVHLTVGWPGEEHNPLQFRLADFVDTIPPTIPPGGVRLYDERATPLTARAGGRTLVTGQVQVVVDAWDQADGNRPGRRLGLHALGYQVLQADGRPAPGFETPTDTIRFDRLAADRTAAHLIYAPGSGIPFYSGGRTRFLYIVTNTLQDGIASEGYWDTTRLPPGDYTLRVWASDAAANTTVRDVGVTIVGDETHR